MEELYSKGRVTKESRGKKLGKSDKKRLWVTLEELQGSGMAAELLSQLKIRPSNSQENVSSVFVDVSSVFENESSVPTDESSTVEPEPLASEPSVSEPLEEEPFDSNLVAAATVPPRVVVKEPINPLTIDILGRLATCLETFGAWEWKKQKWYGALGRPGTPKSLMAEIVAQRPDFDWTREENLYLVCRVLAEMDPDSRPRTLGRFAHLWKSDRPTHIWARVRENIPDPIQEPESKPYYGEGQTVDWEKEMDSDESNRNGCPVPVKKFEMEVEEV